MSKYKFGLALLVSVLALMVLGTATFIPSHTKAETNVERVSVQETFPLLKSFAPAATALQQGQQDELTAVALRKLRAEHNFKVNRWATNRVIGAALRY